VSDHLEKLEAALAGRYDIRRKIGEGGMASVYLARDQRHDRDVAVKVLRPDLAATLGPDRFLREIRIAANLPHPHILPLYDSGEADGFLFYVMPYIEGETLRQRIERETELPVADVVRIVREVADALAFAHSKGVVHRDMKPDNVMISGGHAVVTDFGVAKAVSEATGRDKLTTAGVALGTPAYMAPEQASADPLVDHRADIYAVGAMAYEMLAGRPPFTAATPQAILAAHVTTQPDPVSRYRDQVSPQLEALVMRCLAKKPADRWQSAGELLPQLEALATPSGGITPTDTRPIQATARARPSRSVMAGAAAMVIVAGIFWFALRPAEETASLDDNLVAVMPFRVAGADPDLQYLREGMIDLLAALLTGEGGPRAVEPRAVMAGWRQTAGSDAGELSDEQSAAIARGAGAGRVLLGSVVGSPSRLVLTARLSRTGAAQVTAQTRVEGPADSLSALTERMVSTLLASAAGLEGEQISRLPETSLEVMRAYLDGKAAYRRGDYAMAAERYGRALGLDSSFIPAAIGLVESAGWGVGIPGIGRARTIAWDGRDRLSRRDQLILEGFLGSNGPPPDDRADLIDVAERLVAQLPDHAEAWYLLGDRYLHYGAATGVRDAHARAERAFGRALSLDSSFAAPFGHLLVLRAASGDTAGLRDLFTPYERLDTGNQMRVVQWLVGVALHDQQLRMQGLEGLSDMTGVAYAGRLVRWNGHGVEYLHEVRERLHTVATTDQQQQAALWAELDMLLGFGRPSEVANKVRGADFITPEAKVLFAMYAGVDTLLAAEGISQLEEGVRAPAANPAQVRSRNDVACFLAEWHLLRNESPTAQAYIRMFESDPDTTVNRLCVAHVAALRATVGGDPDAKRLTLEYDSLLARVPPGFSDVGNLEVARLLERHGELGRALSAVRRRQYFAGGAPWFLATYLREEGRLAALTGDREGAIVAYDHYLALRHDPEPSVEAEVDAVRAELARLVGEGR
jgi:tRNA A-37 threonylcarbamoyl transferase component Bud32/tetratricopeptide (TPR) repeat protein